MTPQPLESQVIARVAEDYRRRGYEVDVEPRGARLPAFLGNFRPDLIARNPTDSVVIEAKIGTRTSAAEQLRDVVARVNAQPGWRFALVFVSPDEPDQISEQKPAPLSLSEERVHNAETLLRSGQPEAAFQLLFSALEGILRALARRAQTPLESLPPSALIRELYSAGEIDRQQFESMMALLPVRNRLVHGVGSKERLDVQPLHALAKELLAEAGRADSV
jgi:hypothetical protein